MNRPSFADLWEKFQLNGYFAGTPNAHALTVTLAEPAPGDVVGVVQVNFLVPPGLVARRTFWQARVFTVTRIFKNIKIPHIRLKQGPLQTSTHPKSNPIAPRFLDVVC